VVREIQDTLTSPSQASSVPLVEGHGTGRSTWDDYSDVARRLAEKVQSTGGSLKQAMEEVANDLAPRIQGQSVPKHYTSLPAEIQQHPPKKQGMLLMLMLHIRVFIKPPPTV
jgi:hypothetical protein